MSTALSPEQFLVSGKDSPIIDVRSPGEFSQGHIPGAYNIPLFTDSEREEIGTIYKRKGKDKAVHRGLEIVGPKLASFVSESKKLLKRSGSEQVLVHCWRGGMRSGSFVWLLNTAGIKTGLLKGGYKAYRAHIRTEFDKTTNFLVLGGLTGSGKTEILHILRERGEQVIDLEGLANHKGSAFGLLGQAEQPTTEQFENNCNNILREFDLSKTVWIEGESANIGRVRIVAPLIEQMKIATSIVVELVRDLRLDRIMIEYGDFDIEDLKFHSGRIRKKLGGQNLQAVEEFLDNGDIRSAADILLDYYDKGYWHALKKRESELFHHLIIKSADMSKNTDSILKYLKNNFKETA
ncbi:MAG: tRNA 2-selenouridine(34) synthase MnmH [Bacteriovoracaceae bacterium]|nr:tRNA 2-selenouridine(34) synthase MnmH [Bacteriovoracaceae bacterium]